MSDTRTAESMAARTNELEREATNKSSAITAVMIQRNEAQERVAELEAWQQVARENYEDLRERLAKSEAERKVMGYVQSETLLDLIATTAELTKTRETLAHLQHNA